MEIKNTFNGGPNLNGPKTPEKDKMGNKQVEQDSNEAKTSGDSQVQEGQNIVNEQEQNDIVNNQGGDGAEEYVNDEANINTKMANKDPILK